uniref:ATP synthase complex subunit 8 n=1 Tax=Diadema antillarum TaxID=105358 RepID=Q94PX2_DIAAN|nr:ATPase 8 [Diadema antillarum]AAK60861.1 ATPase 8 [Diadema antillarum]AAK60863.1 ATPase 8 [Diadema antillarum]AAK60871.1 ATPase 8 [Diadema antillarum]AAK60873.1 ATPase 8 [Diadema antillarum]
MPQLDVSWWLVNFTLIWIAVIITFVIISNSTTTSSKESTPSNGSEEIQKSTTEWQWS